MQVSPAGAAMRATLQAGLMLMKHRGLNAIGAKYCDIDLEAWVRQLDKIEELDEDWFEATAQMFVTELIDHKHRNAFLSRMPVTKKVTRATKPARKRAGKKRKDNNADDDDDDDDDDGSGEKEVMDVIGRLLVHTHQHTFDLGKLIEDPAQFVPQLYPLCLKTTLPQSERPHTGLDYRHAMIVHSGFSIKAFSVRLQQAILDVATLRRKCGAAEKLSEEAAARLPVRILFIIWGAAFDPIAGKRYKMLASRVHAFNLAQAAQKTGISIEAYSVAELQYDVSTHELVSTHTVVDPTQIPALRAVAKHQYRYLLDNDPQARVRDLRIGQVVQVTRYDHSVDYLVVVPCDSVLTVDGGPERSEDMPEARPKAPETMAPARADN